MSATEISLGIRISQGAHDACSCCFQGAQEGVRFVDLNGAAIDRGTRLNQDGWVLEGIDGLYLCEGCARQVAECLDFKPELHSSDQQTIRRLELENNHWRAYAKELEESLERRPIPVENRRRRS